MILEPCVILKLFLNFSDSGAAYSYKLYSYKYKDLVIRQQHQYDSVIFISLSISTLGVFSLHSTDFLGMLKEAGFDYKHLNCSIRTLTRIAIRATCYVFCKTGQDWDNTELLFTSLPNHILCFCDLYYCLYYFYIFRLAFFPSIIGIISQL